jgi:tRNA dimethylallyltransferase
MFSNIGIKYTFEIENLPERVIDMTRYLLVLAGPTAVGKTALAIKIAKIYNTEILSADSRQFYREMSIGTAKPSEEELKTVKHHFINNLSILEEYTSGMYEEEAMDKLEELFKIHQVVLLTGGSGLFIKSLCEGLDAIPDVLPGIRQQLNLAFSQEGLQPLLDELQRVDPDYYKSVDRNNPVRVIRALEVYRGTGKPFSAFRTSLKKERPFKIIKVGLNRDRAELYQRIDDRMDQMLANGLEQEVMGLIPFKENNALQTVGYSEVFDFLEGKYDREEMILLLKRNSRRYAKRQLTWFTKDKEFRWFHPDAEEEIMDYLKQLIR